MNLKCGLIGLTLTSVAAFSTANAADIFVPGPGGYKDAPVYSAGWAGWYAGVNGGYGWKSGSDTETVTAFNQTTLSNVPLFTLPGAEPAGGFGGGQIGWNFQRGHLVFGFETDIQGAGINDDKHGVASAGFPTIATTNIDWFGTFRSRTGYAWDGILVYATGGLAYGGVTNKLSGFVLPVRGVGPVPVTFTPHSDTETGFTVGAGIEYKVNPAWSVKAEYQFIDLGSVVLTSNIPGVGTRQIDNNFNTVRLGLNYHVLPAYEPLK
jgi:outer membrane immunogenic protein